MQGKVISEALALEEELTAATSSSFGRKPLTDIVPIPDADIQKIRDWLCQDFGDRPHREERPTFADCYRKPYFAQWQSKRDEFGLTFYESLLFFGWACTKCDLLALAELIELNVRITTAAQYDKFLEARHGQYPYQYFR